MSDEEANWQYLWKPVRDPEDYPGYPPVEVRERIRLWGSSEDWKRWQQWEQFIRGESWDAFMKGERETPPRSRSESASESEVQQ